MLYTSDLHGELLPVPDRQVPGDPKPVLGGIDRLSALVKSEQAKGPCLVLDAGDFMRGSPEANQTRGILMIDLLSRIGYDAICVGERDVPWVVDLIDTIAQHARFRLLGDQILSVNAMVDMVVVRQSLRRELDGLNVGLIGILDNDLLFRERADSALLTSGLAPEPVIDREIKSLRSQNADIIIVLAHMAFERCRRLARRFPEVTAFLCGHEGLVSSVGEAPNDSGPIVAEPGARGQRVGMLQIRVDSASHKVIDVRNRIINLLAETVSPDPEIGEWLASRLIRAMEDSIGVAPHELTFENGNAVAELVREQTGAEIVILPFSVVDWPILKGTVTRRAASRLAPFAEPLVRVKLNDLGLNQVLSSALAQDPKHRPIAAGVLFDVVRPDSQYPDLPARAINVKPDRFKPVHDVVLPRALAIGAGLPSRDYVPVKSNLTEVVVSAIAQGRTWPAAPFGTPDTTTTGQTRQTSPTQRVNINTASAADLETLPGIGPVIAARIVQYREANGPFQTLEDLMKVKGIGKKTFEKLRDKVEL